MLCVLSLQAQAEPYYASKDGLAIWDKATGLVWKRCSVGQKWNGETCIGQPEMNYSFRRLTEIGNRWNAEAGFNDWVLPTVRQLVSIRWCSSGVNKSNEPEWTKCNPGATAPTVNEGAFPNTPSNLDRSLWAPFWTSSLDANNKAWIVDFGLGYEQTYYIREGGGVRLVRASQVSSDDAAVLFPIDVDAELKRIAAAKAEAKAAEVAAQAAAERKAEQERLEAEAKNRADEANKITDWKKLIASGAQSMYLQAGKAQRSGSFTVNGANFYAKELYEKLIEKFPSSEYAVKASDQLTAMSRTDQQASATRDAAAATERAAQVQRNADNNASNRAACFSSVRRCEANCSGSSVYGTCIQQCQRSCN